MLHQAAFDALHAELHAQDASVWGWPVFPEKYRRFDNSAVQKFIEDHQDAVHIYMYLQWIADTQIHEVQSLAEEKVWQLAYTAISPLAWLILVVKRGPITVTCCKMSALVHRRMYWGLWGKTGAYRHSTHRRFKPRRMTRTSNCCVPT